MQLCIGIIFQQLFILSSSALLGIKEADNSDFFINILEESSSVPRL